MQPEFPKQFLPVAHEGVRPLRSRGRGRSMSIALALRPVASAVSGHVRQIDGLLEIMRGPNHRHVLLPPDALELLLHRQFVIASRAPSGSSSSRISGFTVSARASPTRCAIPRGKLLRIGILEIGKADKRNVVTCKLLGASGISPRTFRPKASIAENRPARKQPRLLEYDRGVLADTGNRPPSINTRPASAVSRPARTRSNVALARSARPDDRKHSRGPGCQIPSSGGR